MTKIILLVSIIFTNFGYCEASTYYEIGTGVKYHSIEKTARELALKEAHDDLERRANKNCLDMYYAFRMSSFNSNVVSQYAHFGDFEAKAEVGAEFECRPVCGPSGCHGW